MQSTTDQHFYAAKIFKKSKIDQYKVQKHLAAMKHILPKFANSFIMKMYQSFVKENLILFLVEFVQGQSLYEVIREIGVLNSYDAKFYTANIILILEQFQHQKIIHRDIKPESFMVNKKVNCNPM